MAWARTAWLVGAACALVVACKSGGGSSGTTTSSALGGCHSGSPEALFTLRIVATDAPVPSDTTIRVTWSAGEEPLFDLADKSTWLQLEQSNLVCDVDRNAPVPTDLEELVCQLWTSGATNIEVAASGYQPHDQTVTPQQIDGCDEPVPSEVLVQLVELGVGGGPQ